jgi:hypothetical protein
LRPDPAEGNNMSKSIEKQIQDRDQDFNRYAYAAMRKADPSLPAIPHFVKEEQKKVHPESEGK